MTRDDIIRMAREAHRQLVTLDYPGHLGQLDPWTMQLLERFAALVAAAERKECAALADAQRSNVNVLLSYPEQSSAAYNIGVAIRARGKE